MTDPSDDFSFRCAFSRLTVALLILIPALLSGCGVAYTIIKSESKFDKLTVPMTKAEVVEEIGGPDRILRDDGRMLVWEYSLTARRQWLYELGLCPISVWVGGCIIYPFTNVAMGKVSTRNARASAAYSVSSTSVLLPDPDTPVTQISMMPACLAVR